MASNSPPDVFESPRREGRLTETATQYCTEFLKTVHELTNGHWTSHELKCFAEERDYGTRVVFQLFRDSKLRTQTLVRLTSMWDLQFLEAVLDGQKEALKQLVHLESYVPRKRKRSPQTLSQDSPPETCDSQLQLRIDSDTESIDSDAE